MKIYIVVRNTVDMDFNNVDVFQSVHLTEESAEKAMAQLNEDFTLDGDDTREILERDAE